MDWRPEIYEGGGDSLEEGKEGSVWGRLREFLSEIVSKEEQST